ncbi:MAG TPA: hypothetical protein VL961_10170 [Acidimicrobiales bacterium]|nr:hypothetical protein [Acidimicrobiales bacterium]
MFLIFGVRRRGYRMASVFAMCGVCQTPAAQVAARMRAFFTFFFIPLFPVGTTYRSTCTMCGATTRLTKEQADAAVETARLVHERAHADAVSARQAAALGGASSSSPA